jgi:hypothetical protein
MAISDLITRWRLGRPARGRLVVRARGSFAFEDGAEVAARLAGVFGDLSKLSAIDLGCGPVATPIAQGVFNVPWRRLVSVELFPPYLEALRAKRPAAAAHEIWPMDIRQATRALTPGQADLAIMIDVLEHQTRRQGLDLLVLLERRARLGVVLFSPLGDVPQDDLDGNALQRHRSAWRAEDWLRLGYDVESYEAFHGQLSPPADAAWAIKKFR